MFRKIVFFTHRQWWQKVLNDTEFWDVLDFPLFKGYRRRCLTLSPPTANNTPRPHSPTPSSRYCPCPYSCCQLWLVPSIRPNHRYPPVFFGGPRHHALIKKMPDTCLSPLRVCEIEHGKGFCLCCCTKKRKAKLFSELFSQSHITRPRQGKGEESERGKRLVNCESARNLNLAFLCMHEDLIPQFLCIFYSGNS